MYIVIIAFAGVRRSIKEFRPKLEFQKGKTRSLVKSLPSAMYTSPECLKMIKSRDKDADADYVKEYMNDVANKLGESSCKRKL